MLSTGSRSFSVLAPVMWPVAIRARDWGLGQGQWMLEQRGTEEGEDRGRKMQGTVEKMFVGSSDGGGEQDTQRYRLTPII